MPSIRKSADLRNNYGEIGEEYLAVMSIETYEEVSGKKELYSLLQDGLNDIKKGKIISEEEMDKSLDLM